MKYTEVIEESIDSLYEIESLILSEVFSIGDEQKESLFINALNHAVAVLQDEQQRIRIEKQKDLITALFKGGK